MPAVEHWLDLVERYLYPDWPTLTVTRPDNLGRTRSGETKTQKTSRRSVFYVILIGSTLQETFQETL